MGLTPLEIHRCELTEVPNTFGSLLIFKRPLCLVKSLSSYICCPVLIIKICINKRTQILSLQFDLQSASSSGLNNSFLWRGGNRRWRQLKQAIPTFLSGMSCLPFSSSSIQPTKEAQVRSTVSCDLMSTQTTLDFCKHCAQVLSVLRLTINLEMGENDKMDNCDMVIIYLVSDKEPCRINLFICHRCQAFFNTICKDA